MSAPAHDRRVLTHAEHLIAFPEPPTSRWRPKGRDLADAVPGDAERMAAIFANRTRLEATRLRATLDAFAESPTMSTAAITAKMGLHPNAASSARGLLVKWAAEGLVRLVEGGRHLNRNGGAVWALGKKAC